jgi:hypothetical protein
VGNFLVAATKGRVVDRLTMALTYKRKLVGYYARQGFTEIGLSGSPHGGAEWIDMVKDFFESIDGRRKETPW